MANHINWPYMEEPNNVYSGFNHLNHTYSQSHFIAQQDPHRITNCSSATGGLTQTPYSVINYPSNAAAANPYAHYITPPSQPPQSPQYLSMPPSQPHQSPQYLNMPVYPQQQRVITPQRNYTPDGVTYTFQAHSAENPYRYEDERHTINQTPQQQNSNSLAQHIALKQLETHCLESMLLQEQFKRNPYLLQFTQNKVTTTEDLAGGNKSCAMSDIGNKLYAAEVGLEPCQCMCCSNNTRKQLLIREPKYCEKSIQTDPVTIMNSTIHNDCDCEDPTQDNDRNSTEVSSQTANKRVSYNEDIQILPTESKDVSDRNIKVNDTSHNVENIDHLANINIHDSDTPRNDSNTKDVDDNVDSNRYFCDTCKSEMACLKKSTTNTSPVSDDYDSNYSETTTDDEMSNL